MQVALLANTAWLDEELSSFRFLAVGLIDEMVNVVQVVPDRLPITDAIQFGEFITWQDTGWAWLRRHRLRQLVAPLAKSDVDVIHALHGDIWDAALVVAEALDIPAVLNIGDQADAERLAKLQKQIEKVRVAFSATTAPLARIPAEVLTGDAMVDVVHQGVHLGEASAGPRAEERPLCAIISGAGAIDEDYEALFNALCRIVADHTEVQFFLDAEGDDPHTLWQLAQKLNLLSNMSMVPHRLGHREVQLEADVIIHPQALGRSRSLTLQAMARAVPVLARDDAWLDYLLDDETAWLVDDAEEDQWERLVRRVIESPDDARQLGQRARMWVGKDHLASQQVAGSLALYRKVTGEDMKFPGAK